MLNKIYQRQVDLLLRVLPYVSAQEEFALKGGTAINFFVRDIPRISVDIDLTYIPVDDRTTSLNKIGEGLNIIARQIERFVPGTKVFFKMGSSKTIIALFVKTQEAVAKIEVNPVIRGTVFPCEERNISTKIQSVLGSDIYLEATILSVPDLYGGKICAALDRQHPRDLFDVKILFEKEGVTKEIRKAFLVYLISHDRPIHELLTPNLKDIQAIFENEFQGTTFPSVNIEELIKARAHLIKTLHDIITDDEREFLLSIKEGNPNWSLLEMEGVDNLPAVQWKLNNIKKMEPKKHASSLESLKKVLSVGNR